MSAALLVSKMMSRIGLLEVVALTEDILERKLVRGQVGTVVEELSAAAYEVEFCDDQGQAYASVGVPGDKLMRLLFRPGPGCATGA